MLRIGATAACAASLLWVAGAHADGCASVYETRPQTRVDGTGRFYMGREIAPVMGHLGAAWLERPEREAEERPSLLLAHLGLRRTDVVADIGAGTGYFSFRMAPLVPAGRVIAVDVQPQMLMRIDTRKRETRVQNLQTVLGSAGDPGLPPESVDLVLMVDVYHELAQPCEMMHAVARALRPGGRVVLAEYRAEDPRVPIKPLHKMTQAQAIRELRAAGLVWTHTVDALPWQHLMFFQKR